MSDRDKILSRDPYWNAGEINSIGSFQAMASRLMLDPKLPQDVTNRFNVIKKLFLYSYFAHEFLDVASEIAVLTFEMALTLRYKEITGEQPKQTSRGLGSLVQWGFGQGLFEDNDKIVDNLKNIRNDIAHPKTFQTLGPLALQLVEHVADLCNGLYDDVDLRKARKSEAMRVNLQLQKFVKEGAILELENVRWIVFLATLLHCDNKSNPLNYHFLFWPIFDPTPKNDQVEESEPIIVPCNHWFFSDGIFSLRNIGSQNKVKLVPLMKEADVATFNKWKEDFAKCDFPLEHIFNFRIGELRIAARRGKISRKS